MSNQGNELTMIFNWKEEKLQAQTGIMLHVIHDIRRLINTFMLLPAAEQN